VVRKPGATSPAKVAEGSYGRSNRITWLPDGSGLLAMMFTTVTRTPVTDPSILEAAAKDLAANGATSKGPLIRTRSTDSNLVLVDLAANECRQVTDFKPGTVSSLTVDPSGRYVVLAGAKIGTPFFRRGIRGHGTDPPVSYDELYTGLWLVDLAQGTSTLLMPNERAVEVDPMFSPDGRQVLFTRCTKMPDLDPDNFENSPPPRADVAVFDLGTGVAQVLTSTGHAFGVSWSPDGRWVVYRRTVGAALQLWLVAPDGTRRRLMEPGRRGYPDSSAPVAWAGPSTVVFLDGLSKGFCAVGIDGRGPYPLTPAPLDIEDRHGFSMNPDNQRIAYTDSQGNVCVDALDWSQVPAELRP